MPGGMGPAPERSPDSRNGIGTLRDEDAPTAGSCTRSKTCIPPTHCLHASPGAAHRPLPKSFLPLFIFLRFIQKAGGTGGV